MRLGKCSECENPQTSTNLRLEGGSQHNMKYSEDFQRTLAFVWKHEEASLSSLFTRSGYFVAVVMDLAMFVSVQFSLCNEKLLRDDF